MPQCKAPQQIFCPTHSSYCNSKSVNLTGQVILFLNPFNPVMCCERLNVWMQTLNVNIQPITPGVNNGDM